MAGLALAWLKCLGKVRLSWLGVVRSGQVRSAKAVEDWIGESRRGQETRVGERNGGERPGCRGVVSRAQEGQGSAWMAWLSWDGDARSGPLGHGCPGSDGQGAARTGKVRLVGAVVA